MGRPRTFATADAVRAARNVFWQQGYDGASLPALQAATGLNPSSIYQAFGSKRGLFDAVVASYLDEVIHPLLAPLTGTPVASDALERCIGRLRATLRDASTPACGHGCLLLNCATTPLGTDAALAETLARYRSELAEAATRGVAARFPAATDAERRHTADIVLGLWIAALTLARTDPGGADRLLDTAAATVASP